jgi:hypothetical protein
MVGDCRIFTTSSNNGIGAFCSVIIEWRELVNMVVKILVQRMAEVVKAAS